MACIGIKAPCLGRLIQGLKALELKSLSVDMNTPVVTVNSGCAWMWRAAEVSQFS